jgi:hypothetical protein
MIQEQGRGKGREQEGGLLLEAEKTMRTQPPLRPTCEVMVRYDKVRERAQFDKKTTALNLSLSIEDQPLEDAPTGKQRGTNTRRETASLARSN